MPIQESIQAAQIARKAVAAHCLAAKVEDDESYLHVFFPPRYSLDGVRVTKANGIKWACNKAIEMTEQVWNASKL